MPVSHSILSDSHVSHTCYECRKSIRPGQFYWKLRSDFGIRLCADCVESAAAALLMSSESDVLKSLETTQEEK